MKHIYTLSAVSNGSGFTVPVYQTPDGELVCGNWPLDQLIAEYQRCGDTDIEIRTPSTTDIEEARKLRATFQRQATGAGR